MVLDGQPFTGIAFEYLRDGTLVTEISYLEGLEEGLEIGWHSNGQRASEIEYVGGSPKGTLREWYENGQVKLEKVIGEFGICLSERRWDEQGKLTEIPRLGYAWLEPPTSSL